MKSMLYTGLFLLEAYLIFGLGVGYAYYNHDETYLLRLLVLVFLLAVFEIWLFWKLTDEKKIGNSIKQVLFSYAPCVLFWIWPRWMALNLPEPHNFDLRKYQVLLGLILVSHLILFSGLLIWKALENRPLSKIFAFVAVFFFLGTTLWTSSVCDISGDEPHYLLMAQSLIQDGDLDLSNNYRDRNFEVFYHRGQLQPQALEHVIDGRRYSHHPLGTVLLILPGFALAGRLGAALTMALLAALALYLTIRVLEETGAGSWSLKAVAAIGLFSSPLLLFSGLIFPEIPTACLVAWGLLLFFKKRWAWLGFCLGAMLWVHNRNVLLVMPFLPFVVYEISRQSKDRVLQTGKFIATFSLPVAALGAYFLWIYGMVTPLGAHNEAFTSLFPFHRFFIGFFGLVLDQECGLWFHFPVFALMPAGGFLLFKSRHNLKFLAACTFSFFYLFMSFYQNIGLTPATRYMVGVTPLLLLALCAVFEKMSRWDAWARLTVGLFAVGVFVNWILTAVPWMRYNKLQGENWILKIAGDFLGLPLTRWEAAFQAPVVEPRSCLISLFWLGLTVVLTVMFLKKNMNKNKN